MFIIHDYPVAVVFCVITMLCWGSWGNTQKLAARDWRYEYFYWDYVIGLLIFSLVLAFTMGSFGGEGRSFIPDLEQASLASIGSAVLGGVVFNAANILLSAAISVCGLSVAFPLGIGLALVLGVLVNFLGEARGNPLYIFAGVLLIVAAIICNSLAYRKKNPGKAGAGTRGILLSLTAGFIMSFFYRFVAAAMDHPGEISGSSTGKLTPYSALVVFACGVLISNFIFNTIAMRYPVSGDRVRIAGYFKGSTKTHLVGMLGGAIWCLGQSFSLIASGKAGPAISYGLGQGATLVSAVWGIYVWKEFRDAPRAAHQLNAWMFILFLAGLFFLVYAGSH
ncbi:MAG: multidrug DMT transporter permease [Bacteroidetes bacterium]|nr:multidrug DMT transporter permease [Bacteroidota bacterium]